MIYRGKAVISSKLAKQLKELERPTEKIKFASTLDVIMDKLYEPKRRRRG